MSQFFGQQTLAAQYFRPQYLHGAGGKPASDARSGYWRLFFYQLQEEELKRDEQKQGQEAKKGESEAPRKTTPAVSKKPASSPRRKPVEEKAPPVRERPIYRKSPPAFDVAPWLRVLSEEFKAWNLSSKPLELAMAARKAANDEEEEVITLLLLAA